MNKWINPFQFKRDKHIHNDIKFIVGVMVFLNLAVLIMLAMLLLIGWGLSIELTVGIDLLARLAFWVYIPNLASILLNKTKGNK